MKASDFSVRGKLEENAPLGEKGWFRCGGTADLLFRPADEDDLRDFLKQYPADMPLMTVGGMANTIVRDGGVRGCVIRFGKEFADVRTEGTKLYAGSRALNGTVAAAAAKAGIGGLEFYSGIPGTVGGVLRMNAGSYGTETKDVLVTAKMMTRDGTVHELTPDDLKMAYRHAQPPEGSVSLSAVFEGHEEDPEIIKVRMNEIKERRNDSQPIREKTGGSTFANPDPEDVAKAGLPEGTKVWQLIDQAGCRGLMVGGAQMSEKHCNFMINTGDATAHDLETLGEEVRRRVKENCGIELRWEIRRVGEVA